MCAIFLKKIPAQQKLPGNNRARVGMGGKYRASAFYEPGSVFY